MSHMFERLDIIIAPGFSVLLWGSQQDVSQDVVILLTHSEEG